MCRTRVNTDLLEVRDLCRTRVSTDLLEVRDLCVVLMSVLTCLR